MRHTFVILSLFVITLMGYAQDEKKIIKKNIERNRKIDNKRSYNYFLLDMVKDADAIYSEYEDLVQQVWDKKIEKDMKNTSSLSIQKINALSNIITDVAVYKGGGDYQKTVLTYLDAINENLKALEDYVVLGADTNVRADEYYKSGRLFDEKVNNKIEKRNLVRQEKSLYEKTFYMETKKKISLNYGIECRR